MAEKILHRATLLAIMGLLLVVWFQLAGDIEDNRQAITDNTLAIKDNARAIAEVKAELLGEITGVRSELLGEITGLRTEMVGEIAGLDVKISELGRTIEREFFRNISSNSEHIRELDRRITDLEGGEP